MTPLDLDPLTVAFLEVEAEDRRIDQNQRRRRWASELAIVAGLVLLAIGVVLVRHGAGS